MKKEEQARSLLGISLSGRPRWQQVLICCSGFFFGYLVNGVCLQQTPIQLWMVLHLCARLGLHFVDLSSRTHHQANGESMEDLCEALCRAYGFQWTYERFPRFSQLSGAQIMFKSTKVIPMMIMSSFIHELRRKYPPHEYLSAVLLVVDLILFTLADAKTSPNFSVIGVLMVSGALIMNSFLGNLQEAIFTMNPETTQTEMLFCSTLVGMPFLIPPMLVTGELFKAWTACSEHLYVYGVLVFEAMPTFIGQVSVLSLIALFGDATMPCGLLMIAMGIVLTMLPDYKPSKERATSNSHAKIENTWSREDVGFQTGIEEDEEKRPLV